MTWSVRTKRYLTSAAAFAAITGISATAALADFVDEAKAAVVRYAGPQTKWEGPTAAPKPEQIHPGVQKYLREIGL